MLVPVCALYKQVSAILPVAIGTEPSNHHLVAVLGETAAPRCFENAVFLVTAKISVDLGNPGNQSAPPQVEKVLTCGLWYIKCPRELGKTAL